MNWTPDQVIALNNNPATQKNARKLANKTNWTLAAHNERAVWGLCQGSGKDPYKVCIDLHGPAFKCSCPSREFPCKHSMGLMLYWAQDFTAFGSHTPTPPDWIHDWLTDRDKRNEKKQEKQEAQNTPEALAAKEAQKQATLDTRITQMTEAIVELETWLSDIVRQGIANVATDPTYTGWNDIAASMSNSKADGIANLIRELPIIANTPVEWTDKFLARLGELYLLVQGYKKFDHLPPSIQHEILNISGLTLKKADLLQTAPETTDHWQVLGIIETDNPFVGNLRTRRVWLYGTHTRQIALLLDSSFAGAPYTEFFLVGSTIHATLAYYPAHLPLRAALKQQFTDTPLSYTTPQYQHPSFTTFLQHYAQQIAHSPWLRAYPMLIANTLPITQNNQYHLLDQHQHIIPLQTNPTTAWKLIAISGGHPISVFGEWTGSLLIPLSIVQNGQISNLL